MEILVPSHFDTAPPRLLQPDPPPPASVPVENVAPRVLLGRQPIMDRSGELIGYELLFRSSLVNEAVVRDDRVATDLVILNAIAHFGIAGSLGSHRGFVNIGRASFGSDSISLLDPEHFTLEILESAALDADFLQECRRLKQAGYQIALDDVISVERIPPQVLALIDIVKIDLHSAAQTQLPLIIDAAHAAGCKVLAEKVESADEYQQLRRLGADLFQGYFFARPQILAQRRVNVSHAALLKLNSVLSGEPSLENLLIEVKRNPMLLAQILKLAGSASEAGRRDLTVCEAITRVGTRRLARLAQLLLFANDAFSTQDANPLLQLVNARACFMESMAQELWPDDEALADAAFQTGIFSLMHVVTWQSSEQLLAQLGLSLRIESAILQLDGKLGDLLVVAKLMEGFDTPASSDEVLLRCGLDAHRVTELFARATDEVFRAPRCA